MRTKLVVGLVLFLMSFGAFGCAEGLKGGSKKKHAGTVVSTTGEKIVDVSTKVKTGPTEVTWTYSAGTFVIKDKTTAAMVVSWDAEVDGNTTTRVKTEALPDGRRKLVVNATDGLHDTYLVPIGADGKVVQDINKKNAIPDFSGWPKTEGSYAVDEAGGGYKWFLRNGHVAPSPMKVTPAKKSTGGYEQTISVMAEFFTEVRNPGKGKWHYQINKSANAQTEAADAKDGWREVTLTLPQFENATFRAAFMENGVVVQQDGKDLVMDLSVWDPRSYTVNPTDGTILLRADRGDVCKWNTREVPGRPGTDGYGPNRFGVELVNNIPSFHVYLQLPVLTEEEKKDGQKILVGADWDKFPAEVNPVPWFPGWYEPAGIMGKPKWDTALEMEVVVASSSGSRKRTFEWPEESEYLRPGSKSAIQFTVSGKAYVAPVSTLETGAMLADYSWSQGPVVALRVPSAGFGKTQFRVLGKFTTPKGEVRVDVTLYPELTFAEVTRDNQGNAIPVVAGQEKLTTAKSNTILTAEARPGVSIAIGELQGTLTYPPPVAPATQQTPPLKKEGGFWVAP